MKKLLPLALASLLALTACSQSVAQLNNDGNEAFTNQDYELALAAYQQAQTESPELAEPHFNAANAHYRQQGYEQAQQEIEHTLVKDDGALAQDSYYNLGNTFFQGQQFEQAIESYKEALRLNPGDVEAKHNLELALQQLQQQEQEQQEEQQNQDQNEQSEDQEQEEQQDEQQQQDQNEGRDGEQNQEEQQQDGQQGEQPQDEQEQGDPQDEQSQDGQQGDKEQEQEPQDPQGNQPENGQPGDEQQEAQPNGQPQQVEGLTPEQAKQLFEAATQNAESLEEHLQQILVVPGGQPAEDW